MYIHVRTSTAKYRQEGLYLYTTKYKEEGVYTIINVWHEGGAKHTHHYDSWELHTCKYKAVISIFFCEMLIIEDNHVPSSAKALD